MRPTEHVQVPRRYAHIVERQCAGCQNLKPLNTSVRMIQSGSGSTLIRWRTPTKARRSTNSSSTRSSSFGCAIGIQPDDAAIQSSSAHWRARRILLQAVRRFNGQGIADPSRLELGARSSGRKERRRDWNRGRPHMALPPSTTFDRCECPEVLMGVDKETHPAIFSSGTISLPPWRWRLRQIGHECPKRRVRLSPLPRHDERMAFNGRNVGLPMTAFETV